MCIIITHENSMYLIQKFYTLGQMFLRTRRYGAISM